MNCTYRSIWNDSTGTFVAVSEVAKSAGKKTSSCSNATGSAAAFALQALALSVALAFGGSAFAGPAGGVVAAGAANISTAAGNTTINQSTQNAAINWQSFNVAAGEAVQFVQPSSSSVTLNRVVGADPSSILGSMTANGKVFLVNPNGVLFGKGASVNVGGLVASTLNIADSDFMAGNYKFSGAGNGAVLNQGDINANGGYVALLGAKVGNDGVIAAQLGTVALAAGNAVTLDVAGDGLLNVTVNEGAMNALAQNGGLIQADGGQVLLSSRSASSLLPSAVNNTGVIRAQTLVTGENGSIKLMGDMQSGTVNVGGTLDASAPNGGNGGFVETSAAHVVLADNKNVTTLATNGKTGMWLLDPTNWQIGNDGAVIGDETPASVTTSLASTDRMIQADNDITVAEPVIWTTAQVLTLDAGHDVKINAAITGTNGSLIAKAGHDVKVAAATKTTTGNLSFTAVNDVLISAATTITTGNLMAVAGKNVTVSAASSITTGNMVLRADNDGTGPGVAAGTVAITCGSSCLTIKTGNLSVRFNPASYSTTDAEITAYGLNLTGGGALDAKAWVFGKGEDKIYDGTRAAIVSGLKADLLGVVPAGTLGTVSNALFDTKNVGVNKPITYESSFAAAPGTFYDLFAPVGFAPGTYLTRADITQRDTNISGTRVYDASAIASSTDVKNVDARIGSDDVSVTGTGKVADKNVGLNKNVSDMGTLALAGADAGNYKLQKGALTITQLDTNISGTRVYDATTIASSTDVKNVDARIGSDDVSVTGIGKVADKNVGLNKNVSDMGTLALAGADAGNYKLQKGALTITQLDTNISGTRVYDATTIASSTDVKNVDARIGNDDVSVTGAGEVADKNVGVNKNVVVMPTLALAGADAGNYKLQKGALTITQAELAINAVTEERYYNGNTSSVGKPLPVGLKGSDTLGGAVTQVFDSKDVMGKNKSTLRVVPGSYSVSDGNGGKNYNVTEKTAPGTINPLDVTISGERFYDATTTASSTYLTPTTGVLASEVGSVSVTGGGNVATKDVVLNNGVEAFKDISSMAGLGLGGAGAGNYKLVSGELKIKQVPLTLKADNASKVYGDLFTPAGTAFSQTKMVVSEIITSVAETSTGSPRAASVAGSPYPIVITPGSATGANGYVATNYKIDYLPGLLTVSPKPLTGAITAADKPYDANNSATITGRPLAGVVGADKVTYTGGTATFDNPTVGVGKPVTGIGLGLSGPDAGNYTVNTTATTTATIYSVPPVVVPPVVVPPVVVPPVVVPPVVVPPVVVPPVTPPVVVPPGETTPSATAPEVPYAPPIVKPGVDSPTWTPVVVTPATPPQLFTLAPPPVPPVVVPPVLVVEQPPVIEAPQTPPEIYVAPKRARKQARN